MSKKKKDTIKVVKFGKARIKLYKFNGNYSIHINLGRYKKKQEIDTWFLYDSISKKHEPYAHIWADIQKKKLIGVEVNWDEKWGSKKKT